MFARLIHKLLIFIILPFSMLVSANSSADQNMQVVIVANDKLAFHKEIIDSMHARLRILGANQSTPIVVNLSDADTYIRNHAKTTGLIVTIGTEATSKVISEHGTLPIYGVAVPRLSYDQIHRQYVNPSSGAKDRHLAALYLDQPFTRRLDLIQALTPSSKHIGIVLSPATRHYLGEIKNLTRQRDLQLQIGEVTQESEIIQTLDRTLEKSDVMLGMVDPLVFNRVNARNVLLTAYRWRVPLIGISPSYVQAGALASVYSTPAQIGQQLADNLAQFWRSDGRDLPLAQYPKYFDVAVNYQVAEFLGIHAVSEKELKEKLSRKRSGGQ